MLVFVFVLVLGLGLGLGSQEVSKVEEDLGVLAVGDLGLTDVAEDFLESGD